MKVLGVCSYPADAAATRFRLAQFVDPLFLNGIDLTIRPFINGQQFSKLYSTQSKFNRIFGLVGSITLRVLDISAARDSDLLFIQREAVFFGPAIFERLYQLLGNIPLVLDLDDATYVSYVSPRFGRLGSKLKFFGKTDRLIDRSSVVVCGNRFIAEYVEARGKRAVVIPTVVDGEAFRPLEHKNDVVVIGWIGTHSTYQFLERLFPVFRRLAEKHRFVLRVIGSGKQAIDLPGVEVEVLDWELGREISDFQTLDIGVYPIFPGGSANSEWIQGKSGFKAVQYMAVGVPFVMSPVGVCAEIGEPGKTHLNAETDDDWYNSMDKLLGDDVLRKKMGTASRLHSDENYDLNIQVKKLIEVFRSVI